MNKKHLLLVSSLLFGFSLLGGTATLNNHPTAIYLNEKNPVSVKKEGSTTTLDVPSEFGSKVGESFTLNGTEYTNYDAGYVSVNNSTYTYFGGKNISATGTVSKVALAKITDNIGLDFANANDGDSDNCRALISDRTEFNNTKPIIKQKFIDKYTEAYNNDVILGVKASKVKRWNSNYLVQEFMWGDSNFSYDSNRANVSVLIYKIKDQSVYILKDGFVSEVNDNHDSLGQPTSDATTREITLPGATAKTSELVQTFETGFIYKNGSNYTTKTGYIVNEDGSCSEIALPEAPGEYGDLTGHVFVSDKKQIAIYQYGSIICEKTDDIYEYTLRPGRLYTTEKDYTMVDIETCYAPWADEIAANDNPDYGGQAVADKLKAKYKEYYDKDYFIGFQEGTFDDQWNKITAQQFKWGDSSANPWNDGRDHVAALVYNSTFDSTLGQEEVVLLKDKFLELWDDNYSYYGSPVTDEITDDDGRTLYQQFMNGLMVFVNGDSSLSMFISDGTIADYKAGKDSYDRPTFGKTWTVTTTDNTSLIAVAIAVPAAVVAVGLVTFFIVYNKHKSKIATKESKN